MATITAASSCLAPHAGAARTLRMASPSLMALRPQTASRALVQRTGAGALQRKHASRAAVQTRAAVELFQLAGEGAEISTAASVMFAITLVGLAVGFVLLRFESLVEEGKL